ncbi:GTPase RsgA [Sphingopyxis sp.]|uniref:GTPase RsgA n=1 Tax=Sphingopyxis sp. TaxID=1908224 RepID=UPI0025E7F05A|nr:GTPase RsgA [Sphingopyxis sp.]MBK6413246.1 GTPase RsgA [Sphingopyxis sp.]
MRARGQHVVSPYIAGAGPADDHPTVGDWLLIDRDTLEPVRVLERLNLFKRRAPGDPNREQMIAANVDTLFVVASCNQDFSVARLERYLVLAREVGVKPVVVLTKTDLTDDPQRFVTAASAIEPGLQVEPVNGRDPASVARLAAWCGKGETVALLGSSGSANRRWSIPCGVEQHRNAGDPPARRHRTPTTTVREMHRLDHGGWLLDTPGMRELQLPQATAGIAEIFDDFILIAEHCRFSDCAHGAEPDCAVRAAINAGTLTIDRFERWQKLAAEDNAAAHPPKRRR